MSLDVIISPALFTIGVFILVRSREAFIGRLNEYLKSPRQRVFLPPGPRVSEMFGMAVGLVMVGVGLFLAYRLVNTSTPSPPPEWSPTRLAITALLVAAGAGYLVWDVHRDRQGRLLYHAVCDGDEAKVGSYLKKGISVHRTFDLDRKKRCTYLHSAATCGQTGAAKLLLEAGAKVDARAGNGATPLHFTCQMGYLNLVELLLQYGAGLEATDNVGMTALHYAVVGAAVHPEFERYIARLREQNPNSPRARTALSGISHCKVVCLLLSRGAQKDRRNGEYGKTPAEMAKEAGLGEIEGLFCRPH